MSSYLKTELAATCTTLGRLHKGEYLIEPECIESVKDLIRYLKRDNDTHEIRRYLGEAKVLQNDLIHVVKTCPEDNTDLFDVTLRLLINLTTPALLFYGEEVPAEKTARNIYLSLTGYQQEYKIAFCDVQFWNKVCGKLTNLFETDWAERSADDGIQIERILMLVRNVLQVPTDEEAEKRPDNDVTVHDRVLWALRQSQILELLLFVASNRNEEQYYLNLLEIFSLILREQNPKVLARCDIHRSAEEKSRDSEELLRVRESERKTRNKYQNMRNFSATFVVKGMKSLSDNDVVCHKSLDKVAELNVVSSEKKKVVRTRRNRLPVESERAERRSTFSVRLFLKEFCLEFLNSAFGHLMTVVKSRLDSGKTLPNDQTYYFWAVKFFMEFATASDSDPDLIKSVLSTASFHFVQTSMENALEHLAAEKKKAVEWIRRIHLILKAYHSLLETLLWMDLSKNPLTRSISREIKSQIFYVAEYREMTLQLLLRYDPSKFSVSYLRDLIETTHLFVKLLEEYSKQTRMVVQNIRKKKPSRKRARKKEESRIVTGAEKWEQIKDEVYDSLCGGGPFPEIPPFDASLDVPIDDQKGRAMKLVQTFLRKGKIADGIGLLRSARQVWPENDYFGSDGMSVEEETMALQEICVADMGEVEEEEKDESGCEEIEQEEERKNEEFADEIRTEVVEQDFDIMEYKKRLVNKRVVEGCGILLKNYRKNSDHTNHCVIKLLHRIGWECCMPALLFQASLFWTLLGILKDKGRCYGEINTFTLNLLRKFRKHAAQNPVVFLELLFWKDNNVALEIQHGYQAYEEKKKKPGGIPKKKKMRKTKMRSEIGEEEDEKDEEEVEKDDEDDEEDEKEKEDLLEIQDEREIGEIVVFPKKKQSGFDEEEEGKDKEEQEKDKRTEVLKVQSANEMHEEKTEGVLKKKKKRIRIVEDERREEEETLEIDDAPQLLDIPKKKKKSKMRIKSEEEEEEENDRGEEKEEDISKIQYRYQVLGQKVKTKTGSVPRKKKRRIKLEEKEQEEEKKVDEEKGINTSETHERKTKRKTGSISKKRKSRIRVEEDEHNGKEEEEDDEEKERRKGEERLEVQVQETKSSSGSFLRKKKRRIGLEEEEEEKEASEEIELEEERNREENEEEGEDGEEEIVRRPRKRRAVLQEEDED